MQNIHVTVAAIIQHKDRFLMVEEDDALNGRVYNQPAGHVEPEESIVDAVIREVYEETGLTFNPISLIGNYFLSPAANGKHYLRFCFYGEVEPPYTPQPQDSDIIEAHWLTLNEICALRRQLRSALVLKCLEDFLSGQRYPLDQFHFCNNELHLADLCYTRLPQQ
jgi:8-oxo-dGTP pyrophosphatase MutT (NUDIX family)